MKYLSLSLLVLVCFVTAVKGQWKPSSAGLRIAEKDTLSVYAFAELDTLLFSATSYGVFMSTDHGYSWRGQHWGKTGPTSDNSVHDFRDLLVQEHRYYLDHPKWNWVRQSNNPSVHDSLSGRAIAVDPSGCAIVAATLTGSAYYYDDTLKADSGALLLMKYDTTGTLLWMKQANAPQKHVNYTSVACDSAGNIYAAGILGPALGGATPTVTFGTQQIAMTGHSSPFLVCYDSKGNFKWVQAPTATGTVNRVWVTADAAGYANLLGDFTKEIRIGNRKVSSYIGKSSGDSVWEFDYFLARFLDLGLNAFLTQSSSKNAVYPKLGDSPGAMPLGLCTDPRGNSYILGYSWDTMYVADQRLISNGQEFLCKYDNVGRGRWAKAFETDQDFSVGTQPFESISCDQDGKIALCGTATGPVTINGKSYATDLTSNSTIAATVASFDSTGSLRWFKNTMPDEYARARHIAVSGGGTIYVNLDSRSISFDSVPIRGSANLEGNAPMVKMSTDGKTEWAFADGLTGVLAPRRHGGLYALYAPSYIDLEKGGRFGRIGYMGSMALANLTASAPGWTIDTDLYAMTPPTLFALGTIISVDRGYSWYSGAPSGYQMAQQGSTLFTAAGITGIDRSTDGGESWSNPLKPSPSMPYVHAMGSSLTVSTTGSNYTSFDSGLTWKKSACSYTGGGMHASLGSHLYALGGGVSNDSGQTWIRANIGLNTRTPRFADSKAFATIGDILLDGSNGVNASSNFGESWSPVGSGFSIPALSFYQYGNEVLMGTQGAGIWRRPISEIRALIKNVPPTFIWAEEVHAKGDATGHAIAVDKLGNTVVVGSFVRSVKLDSQTTYVGSISEKYDRNYYVAKYDPEGGLIWSFDLHGNGRNDTAMRPRVAMAPSGEIYVGGTYYDSLRVGGYSFKGKDYPAIFLLKCNASGQLLWADSVSKTNANTTLTDLAVDRNGNPVFVGHAVGQTSIGGIVIPSTAPGAQIGFIAQYDPNGTINWVDRLFPTKGQVYANALTISSNNAYYVGGRKVDGIGTVTAGLFLAHYNPAGTMIDSFFAGRSARMEILSLTSDDANNIYAGGATGDSIALGASKLIPNGSARFLAQYQNGTWKWAKLIGYGRQLWYHKHIPFVFSMATNASGETYVAGLDSVFGQSNLEAFQGMNFVTKYGATGEREWTKQLAIDDDASSGAWFNIMGISALENGIWTTGALLNNASTPRNLVGCNDIAFGLHGLGMTSFDSNYTRPFVSRLSNAVGVPMSTPLAYSSAVTLPAFTLYPNPLSASGSLTATIEEPDMIRVTVYDLLGRELGTVFSGPAMPGRFTAQCDFENLSSGEYYLRIQCAKGASTIRLRISR